MAVFMDLKGTSQQTFQIQKGGARIKSEVVDSSPSLSIRLPDDTDYSSLKAYDIYLSGYQVSFMVDETGPDLYPLTLAMPGSGMTGAVTYTLPPAPINGNVLSVDAGGNMSWVAPASTAGKASLDVVTQATADTSKTILPVALGQSHFVHTLVGRITQVFDVDPLLTVGDSGDASKLVAATDYDLSAMSVGDVINIPFGDALAVGSALTAAYGAAPGTGSIKWSVVSVIV